jgi:hypothetical protein
MLAATATAIKLRSGTLRQTLGIYERKLHTSTTENLPELTIVDLTGREIEEIRKKAATGSAGIEDGLGNESSVPTHRHLCESAGADNSLINRSRIQVNHHQRYSQISGVG